MSSVLPSGFVILSFLSVILSETKNIRLYPSADRLRMTAYWEILNSYKFYGFKMSLPIIKDIAESAGDSIFTK